ncbi:MAG: hypothetical protein ACRC0F_11185 [Cetobacterium sp.]
MNKFLLTITILSSFTFFSGCSSIINGSKQRVTAQTSIENLQSMKLYKNGFVIAEGKENIAHYTLDRKSDYMIEVIDSNGKKQLLLLDKEITGAAFLNLLNILGWGIDFISGSVYKQNGQSPYIIVK